MQSSLLAKGVIILSIVTRISAQFSYSALTNKDAPQTGQATFYGAGQDSQGTCSFSANFANTNDLPWTTGAALTLALNDDQFANGAACGLCVMYRGTGAGIGTTPVPATWTLGFVNNRCPECSKGDLDQATSGDGRWNVEWYAVPCNVGSSSLVYSIVVSSYYWFSLVVSNTRTPITGVAVNIGGSWLDLVRTNNNQWAYYNTNGPWQSAFPMGIRVTNVLGETVSDTITSASGNSGTAQFSADGSGGISATAAGNTSSTMSGAPTSMTPPSSAVPPSVTTTPPAALETPPPPAPPPMATPPPATPPAPLAAGGFYVEDYQQCGGSGSNCNTKPYTAAPCADAAWPLATCMDSSFGCVRYDSTLWTCVPGAATPSATNSTSPPGATAAPQAAAQTPPEAVAMPPPAVAQTPPVAAATIPPPMIEAPPTALSPPPMAGNSIAAQQGAAESLASTPPPVASGQSPPLAAAQPQPVAAAQSPPPAQALPPPVTASPPPATTQSSSSYMYSIAVGGQCGGTSQCTPVGQPTDKVTCNNGPWAGAVCSGGTVCQADPGPLIWTCKSSSASVATGGRRLLNSSMR